ncbi:prenyltransferase/squalene oxidase repeat-containing protein [Paenibacillus sp. SI8]|uniref:prenyltransferase/squalene oxidase repeat-containing protein n=1 Tax=unclassified Paenibacillus TaxID=185978 RepID=UPI0034671417
MSVTLQRESQLDYLWNALVDHAHGGVLTAVDASGVDFICDDKQLEDQALAVIALTHSSIHLEKTASLVQSLSKLKDPDYAGYVELTDRYWRPHAPGYVKTVSHQLLASLAFLEYGSKAKQTDRVQEGLLLLEKILDALREHRFARLLDRDWSRPLDDKRDLKTAALAVLALEKAENLHPHLDLGAYWDQLLPNLQLFLDDTHGGAHDKLTAEGNPILLGGKRLESQALAAFALARYARSHQRPDLLLIAEQLIDFIAKHLPHPMYGGYWDRSRSDGTVQVDGTQGYFGSASPFPVLKVSDHAILLLALHEISQQSNKPAHQAVAKTALTIIDLYTDRRSGGVFLGQGNWFSTPVDPTVPLGRHFWVPPHTPGAFHAGNFAYVPLQQKQAYTQAWVGLALETAGNPSLEKAASESIRNTEPLTLREVIVEEKAKSSLTSLTDPRIDIPSYIKWLKLTKSGGGYGLTPYRSPLGFRSDRSSQVFSTLHVLADFHVLKEEIPDQAFLASTIRVCQNPDGGFGEQPGHPSESFTTYCGVLSLYILGELPSQPEACITYLQSCQNPDGGFGNAPGYRSDVWHTNLSVAALTALGAEPLDKAAAVRFIVSCADEQGAYGIHPGAPTETFSAYRAISSLYLLGYEPPHAELTAQWLKSCQTSEGGFVYRPGRARSFVGSYHAIAALYLLGELPDDAEACKSWMAAHQNPDGGFGRQLGGVSDTTDEGFICLHAAYMLDGKLSRYWTAIVS